MIRYMRFISCVKCSLSLLLNTEAFSDQLYVFSSFCSLFKTWKPSRAKNHEILNLERGKVVKGRKIFSWKDLQNGLWVLETHIFYNMEQWTSRSIFFRRFTRLLGAILKWEFDWTVSVLICGSGKSR